MVEYVLSESKVLEEEFKAIHDRDPGLPPIDEGTSEMPANEADRLAKLYQKSLLLLAPLPASRDDSLGGDSFVLFPTATITKHSQSVLSLASAGALLYSQFGHAFVLTARKR